MSVKEEACVEDIRCFCITNSSGVVVRCISQGATLTQMKYPDGTDAVLGMKDIRDYRTNPFYIGCSVGRVANRIRNSTFSLDGQPYTVSANEDPHTLHGGETGFNKANWTVTSTTDNSVTFQHVSPAGDMGYPGTLTATATYRLAESGEVEVEYTATTDSPTIVNLVNHSYFNLSKEATIHNHVLRVSGQQYTPLDEDFIVIGRLDPVAGTPLDFTTPTPVGSRMDQVGGEVKGYDINYVLDRSVPHPTRAALSLCAVLQDPSSDHQLKVYTDQPGVQLYVAQYLDSSCVGKDGKPMCAYGGLCLETQAWPNAINFDKDETPEVRKQMILRPGDTYRSKTVWALGNIEK